MKLFNVDKLSGGIRFTQSLINMKVPVNYVKLQAEILAAFKAKRILTWEDILR